MRSSRAACVRVYGCGFCGPMVVMEVMEGWAIGRSMWLLTVQHHESWSQIVANSLHDVNCKAVVLPPPYMQYTCRTGVYTNRTTRMYCAVVKPRANLNFSLPRPPHLLPSQCPPPTFKHNAHVRR